MFLVVVHCIVVCGNFPFEWEKRNDDQGEGRKNCLIFYFFCLFLNFPLIPCLIPPPFRFVDMSSAASATDFPVHQLYNAHSDHELGFNSAAATVSSSASSCFHSSGNTVANNRDSSVFEPTPPTVKKDERTGNTNGSLRASIGILSSKSIKGFTRSSSDTPAGASIGFNIEGSKKDGGGGGALMAPHLMAIYEATLASFNQGLDGEIKSRGKLMKRSTRCINLLIFLTVIPLTETMGVSIPKHKNRSSIKDLLGLPKRPKPRNMTDRELFISKVYWKRINSYELVNLQKKILKISVKSYLSQRTSST